MNADKMTLRVQQSLNDAYEIAVKYKLKGAVSKKADIFFAPSGSNYEEAMCLKKKYGYKIKVIEVKTIDDAISYLKKLK